jgi:hypothetical protein
MHDVSLPATVAHQWIHFRVCIANMPPSNGGIMLRRQLAIQSVLTIAALVAATSCSPDEPERVPSNGVTLEKPRTGARLLSALSASFTSETNETHDTIAMGTFPEATVSIVTATGYLAESYGSPWAQAGDATGRLSDPSGAWNFSSGGCEHCISWFVTGSGSMGGHNFGDANNGNWTPSITDTQVVKGTAYAVYHGGAYYGIGPGSQNLSPAVLTF